MPDDVQIETLNIKFSKSENTDHSVDASTVVASINVVNSLVERVHREYESDNKYLLKARPFNKGSLEIPLDLIFFVSGMLLGELPFFEKVRDILKQFIDIKKTISGRSFSVNEGNIIVVENSEIHVESVVLEMLNPNSEQSKFLSELFTKANEEETVTSVSVFSSSTSNAVVVVPREEFSDLSRSISEDDISPTNEINSQETVTIRSVAFDNNLRWHFYWEGRAITAKVLDDSFKNNIAQRTEVFVSGDKLEVDMTRIQKYDTQAAVYVDNQFIIAKVHNHIKPSEESGGLFE